MPIARKILSMFELGRKQSQVILVLFLHRKEQKSQRISVPTDRQTLSMHRYLQCQALRRSVGTPLESCAFDRLPTMTVADFEAGCVTDLCISFSFKSVGILSLSSK